MGMPWLQVGTEAAPYPKDKTVTIQLHGHVRSQELPIYGTKCLAVRHGTLDLHGKCVELCYGVMLWRMPERAHHKYIG